MRKALHSRQAWSATTRTLELTVTTQTAGIVSLRAGNYGEQITNLTRANGGYEVTWTGDKSSIKVDIY